MRKSVAFVLLSFLMLFAETDDLFEFKKFLALPVFAYAEETGWIIGAGALIFVSPPAPDGSKAGSNNSTVFMSSFKKQATFVNKHVHEPVNENWNFVTHFYLNNWPSQFYKIGNDWHKDIYDVYTSKNVRFDIAFGTDMFLPNSWNSLFNYGVEFDAEYIAFDYGRTDKTELENLRNLKNSARLGLGYNLTYNSSERNDWPRKGSIVQAKHIYFNAENGCENAKCNASNFIWKNLDIRTYIPLPFLPEGVLALGSYLEDFDGDVPFDRLAQPDGVGQLRGLKKGYLADKTSWVLQSELRTHLFWRCKATLFYEKAKVGNGFKDLNHNEWHDAIGIGGRFMVNSGSKTHIRGDVSLINRKDIGMAIKINEAF